MAQSAASRHSRSRYDSRIGLASDTALNKSKSQKGTHNNNERKQGDDSLTPV
jgi:hypothetical protein